MLAFPIGGVGTGSISLGGRGQLRDWEIFNRPDQGRSPEYAFASIWAQAGTRTPVAHVLEARIMPPYEGSEGLGSKNAPGLSRLEGATFTGEFPVAQVEFHDSRLPVNVRLDAFSPFIPLDAEESGLPVAVLRYVAHIEALPEWLRHIAENRMILYSLLLIVLMLTRPQGLFGAVNLKRRKA